MGVVIRAAKEFPKALFSSKSDEWETPDDLFEALDAEFHFDLDVAASAENAKCATYYTKEQDGLVQPWRGSVWCNPPYTRGQVGKWLQKGVDAVVNMIANKVVYLLPSRTGTKWFHNYVWNKRAQCPYPYVKVRFLQGRLRFGGAENVAPFDSMIVVME